jgi:hypothetical protein
MRVTRGSFAATTSGGTSRLVGRYGSSSERGKGRAAVRSNPESLWATTIQATHGLRAGGRARGRARRAAIAAVLAKLRRTGDRTATMSPTSQAEAQTPAPAAQAPGQPVTAQAPAAPSAPIPSEQAEFLRLRRTALSNQLESAQERRDDVAEALRDPETQASERPGLQKRLEVLDQRLVDIEKEIALNGQALANAPARRSESSTQAARASRGPFLDRVNPNLITIFSFALLMPLAVQFARRFVGPNNARVDRAAKAEAAELRARLDKMESAVEAVSIEVERVGEGQRFLTQTMMQGAPRAQVDAAVPVAVNGFEDTSVSNPGSFDRR